MDTERNPSARKPVTGPGRKALRSLLANEPCPTETNGSPWSCKSCDDHRSERAPRGGPRDIVHACRRHTAGGAEMPCFRDDQGGPPEGCHSRERER